MLALFHTCRHNDLPDEIRINFKNQFNQFDLRKNGSSLPPDDSWHTDIPRLKAGKVGGQV